MGSVSKCCVLLACLAVLASEAQAGQSCSGGLSSSDCDFVGCSDVNATGTSGCSASSSTRSQGDIAEYGCYGGTCYWGRSNPAEYFLRWRCGVCPARPTEIAQPATTSAAASTFGGTTTTSAAASTFGGTTTPAPGAPVGQLLPRWGGDPSVASCKLASPSNGDGQIGGGQNSSLSGVMWDAIIKSHASGAGAAFRTGGLGGLQEAPRFEVWVCEEGHSCANGTSAFFCFAYDEVDEVFVPWGPNSLLRLVR